MGVRRRGSRADAGAIKATGECDECGQSVKPPPKSQYYLQDILWCLRGLDKDKTGREGPGWVGGVEKERQEEGKREGDVKSPRLSHFHPESCHHQSITHSIFLLITNITLIALFPFHFLLRSSSFCPLPPVYYPPPSLPPLESINRLLLSLFASGGSVNA